MHSITDFINDADPSQWVSYENGNTEVFLNIVDGTKLRYTDDDEFDESDYIIDDDDDEDYDE